MDKKLYRDEYHKKIAGVCAGLAEYFNIDVAIVRVVFVLALIFHGGGFLIYIIFWIVLPKKPIYIDPTVDYRVPPSPGSPQADAGNSFGANPYSGGPYGNAYGTGPAGAGPFQGQPFPLQPRNSTSLVAIVFGVVLIIVGGSILLDDFDILPDWNIERLWPIILIVVGCALMISGERKKPWENPDWNKVNPGDSKPADQAAAESDQREDNPPTV
jgi:phage shock protein C